MGLREIEIEFDEQSLTEPVGNWIQSSKQRVQEYWDRFREKPLPQYVECDFEFVAAALGACRDQQLADGNLFVEWGCGFGVVTGIAALLGYESIGIEAESFLCDEARELLARHHVDAEIWCGNFLPYGASRLADDSDPIVSLSHHCDEAYSQRQFDLTDFAIVFAYPWPGEEHFLKLVFQQFARPGALLLMYRGPYQIELFRRVGRG